MRRPLMPNPGVKLRVEFGGPVRWARGTIADPNAAWRYGFAVGVALAAAGIRLAFEPIIGAHIPYLPFTLAVTVSSLFGGCGPGLTTSLLSAVISDWLFLRPLHSFAIADPTAIWGLGLFLFSVVLISLLLGSLRESVQARARVEEELRRNSQLIDLSQDAVVTMDHKRRILTWNKGAEEIYGWPKEDAAGKVFPELLKTVAPIPLSEIDEILRREGRWEGELIHTARNGRLLDVDSRQVLIGGGDGLPPSILAISRDITQRKQNEEALRASEARLEFVLEAAKLGAWDLDFETHAAWRSPQHDAIFGYADLLPEWTDQMSLDHVLPEDRKMVAQKLHWAESSGADLQFECRIRRNDGAVRWIWA